MPSPTPTTAPGPEIRWTDPLVKSLLEELLKNPEFHPVVWPLPVHCDYVNLRYSSYTNAVVHKLGILNRKYQTLKYSGKLATGAAVEHYRDPLYNLSKDKKEIIEQETARFTAVRPGKWKEQLNFTMTPPGTVSGISRPGTGRAPSTTGSSRQTPESILGSTIHNGQELEDSDLDEEMGDGDGSDGGMEEDSGHSSSKVGDRRKKSGGNGEFISELEKRRPPTRSPTASQSTPAVSTAGGITGACPARNSTEHDQAPHEYQKQIITLYKIRQRSRRKLEKMHREQDRKEFENFVLMMSGNIFGHNVRKLLQELKERGGA